MAKSRKNFLLILLLAVCLTACVVLAACNPDPEPVAYTVTVKIGDNPVKDVSVSILQGENSYEAKTTGEDGKATFELVPDNYTVELDEATLPAHYCVAPNADLTLAADKRELTITLAQKFAYIVRLTNPDGSAFYRDGVKVGICTVGNASTCSTPVAIDQGGVAYIEGEPKGDYHVQILGLPETYAFANDGKYYTGKDFSATETDMSIKIYPVEILTPGGTAMTAQEKEAFATTNSNYGSPSNNYQALTAYKFTKTLAAGEKAYFAIKVDMPGKYNVFINYDNYVTDESLKPVKYFNGKDNIFETDIALALYNNEMVLEKNVLHYIAMENTDDEEQTANLVIACPDASYTEVKGVEITDNVTINKEDAFAVIAFTPTQAGKYTLTTQGEARTYVVYNEYVDMLEYGFDGIDPSVYAKQKSETNKLTSDKLGGTMYFAVKVAATDYPQTIGIKITQDKKFEGGYTSVEVTEQLAQQSKPANMELAKLPMTEKKPDEPENDTLVYNSTDKFYHYGSETGEIVYVLITQPLDSLYEEDILASFDINYDKVDYALDFTPQEDIDDLDKNCTMTDYRLFLRGFKKFDYDEQFNASIPDPLENTNCYANYVNEDGAYPLTKELELFLKELCSYERNQNFFETQIIVDTVDAGCEWMFALYYYVPETIPEVIVGEYKLVSITENETTYNVGDVFDGQAYQIDQALTDGKLTEKTLKVVITKKEKFNFYLYNPSTQKYGDGDYEYGTWEKADETFTFTCNEGGTLTYSNDTLTYTDVEGYIFIFTKVIE